MIDVRKMRKQTNIVGDFMLNDERIGVSIVCLSYNNEKYIGQMLDSLICQRTTFNYEILIHDDASTDNTQQIIGRYAKAYPKLIKPILQTENQYSKGVSPNMTFNYPRVKGKYVAFCEGDDYWANPNKLQSQFEIMETNPKCSICVHETQCVSPDGEPIRQKFPPINVNRRIIEKRRYLEYELKRGLWMFQTSSYFIRSEIIRNYMSNYNNQYPVGDMPMVFYALQYGDCYYIPRVMSCYRTQSGGVMSSLNNRPKHIQFQKKMIEGHQNFDAKTRYVDHDLFEYAEKRHEVSILLLEKKYREIATPRYKEILNQMSVRRKAIIMLGYFFPETADKLERFRHGWSE